MILRTARPRSAFTLVEMLVVIFIIIVLLSISIGALMKGMDWMKANTTEQTMGKVYTRIEKQAHRIRGEANNWNTPAEIMVLAANNQRRARVIQFKYLTKWSYPMSFFEVRLGYLEGLYLFSASGGYAPATRLHNELFAKDPNFWTAAVPAEYQSAILLAMIYGTGDDLSGNELGTYTYNRVSDGLPVTLNYVQDGWYTPTAMYRWPTGPGAGDRIQTYIPGSIAATDQDDPEGLLYDDAWQQLTLAALGYSMPPALTVSGTTFVHQEIEARFHPIRRSGAPSRRFAPLTLVSAGPLRLFGLEPLPDLSGGYPGPNPLERMQRLPINAIDRRGEAEFDNIYSFRLRLGTQLGN